MEISVKGKDITNITIVKSYGYKVEEYPYKNRIKVPDKKFFHKTKYAKAFFETFGVELKPNTEQFNLTYDTYKTLIKISKGLYAYKQNKQEKCNYITKILEEYFNINKNKINKCWDSTCIELYDIFEKWYDELLEMKEIHKYKFDTMYYLSCAFIAGYELNHYMKYDFYPKHTKYDDNKTYKIKEQRTLNHTLGYYDRHSHFLKNFKIKYKQTLTLKEYFYVKDTLTIIIYMRDHIDDIKTLKSGLKAYFKDYPQKLNINDDFNTTYEILTFIFQNNDINTTNLMLKSLLQKNIHFFTERETI